MDLCDQASQQISLQIIKFLINNIITKRKGVSRKKSVLICLKHITAMENLSSDICNDIEKCQLNIIIKKLNFEEMYPNIYSQYVKLIEKASALLPPTVIEESSTSIQKNCSLEKSPVLTSNIVDYIKSLTINDEWYYNQVMYLCTSRTTSTSSVLKKSYIVELLMGINSESKLQNLINSDNFDKALLIDIIKISFHRMLSNFKNVSVQFNPHIHYLRIPFILKIALNSLQQNMKNLIVKVNTTAEDTDYNISINTIPKSEEISEMIQNVNIDEITLKIFGNNEHMKPSIDMYLFEIIKNSIIHFLQCLENLEDECRINIDVKLIEKFVNDNFLMISSQREFSVIIIQFLQLCLFQINLLIHCEQLDFEVLTTTFMCVDVILKQKSLWTDLNMLNSEIHEAIILLAVNSVYDYMKYSMEGTSFFNNYQDPELFKSVYKDHKLIGLYLKTIFISKFIEERNMLQVVTKFDKTQVCIILTM